MKRTDAAFAKDIVVAAGRIRTYIHRVSKEKFLRTPVLADAVIRQLGIIGEAASKLTPEFRAAHEGLPWKQIIGFRHIVVHQYWEVDLDVVWQIAKDDTLLLVTKLKAHE